jgi:hypothetical protein
MNTHKDKGVNSKKIILDLCGGTGAWSRPYKEAGYDVRVITLPDWNVGEVDLNIETIVFHYLGKGGGGMEIKLSDIYGILAAPPCTMFSDARTKAKTPRDLREGLRTVVDCMRIIWHIQLSIKSDQQKYSPLKFWALENPWYGRLKWFLGNPKFEFSPWEFGDAYKKRTAIWGYFNEPIKTVTDINSVMTKEQQELHKTNSQTLPKFDYMRSKDIHPEYFKTFDRQTRRAITPKGFAEAFFKANL